MVGRRVVLWLTMLGVVVGLTGIFLVGGSVVREWWNEVRERGVLERKTASLARKIGSLRDRVDLHAYAREWVMANRMVPMPYVGGTAYPNLRGRYVTTNDLGFRERLDFAAILRQAGERHRSGGKVVVLTGGSAVFGAYADDDRSTLAAYLNQALAERQLPVTVYNFGMMAFTSDDELALLTLYLTDLSPDLLVVMDGYNDAIRVALEGYAWGVGIPYIFPVIRESYPLVTRSRFLDRRHGVGDEAAWREVVVRYRRNLGLMQRVMVGLGGKSLLALQPIRYLRGTFTGCPMGEEDRFITLLLPRYGELGHPVAGLEGESLDLTGLLVGREDGCSAFVDNVHLSSVGQRLVAERLLPEILERLGVADAQSPALALIRSRVAAP